MQTHHAEHGLLADEALLHTQQTFVESVETPAEPILKTNSPYCFDEVTVTEETRLDEAELALSHEHTTAEAEAEAISMQTEMLNQTEFSSSTPLIPDPIIQRTRTLTEELFSTPVVEDIPIHEFVAPEHISHFKIKSQVQVV